MSSLGSACSTTEGAEFSIKCNPALFPYTDEEGIVLSVIGKSDGDSIDNGQDLIFDPISEQLIRKLFQDKNYTSFTFNGDIEFKNSLFNLTYSPYYLLADLYLFNPAFPEISIHLVSRETIRLTSGMEVFNFSNSFDLSFGSSIFYYEHSYENTVFSLFDLSIKKPEELISFSTVYGVAADIGFFLNNDSKFIPKLSLQVKNINSDLRINESHAKSAFRQSSLFLFETYSQLGFGKSFKTKWGRFDLGIETYFTDIFKEVAPKQTQVGVSYQLGLFSVFSSLSKYYQNLGLRFSSKHFNVGVTYSREKDLGSFQNQHDDSVYTGVEISL